MATPTVDKILKGNLVMHDHSEADLGAILDSRYVNVTGDAMTGTLSIAVPTTTSEALILQTTDDNATKNLFEVKDSGGSNLAEIDSNGYMGIGGQDPVSRLHVSGATANDYAQFDYGINLNPVKEPTSLGLALSSGTELEISGYYYSVQYITDLGETNLYPIDLGTFGSYIETTAGNQNVTITVPVSSDYRVTGRKIWRTGPTLSYAKYLVAYIEDNTTTEIVDDVPDATLLATTPFPGYSNNTTAKPIQINGISSFSLQYANTLVGIEAGLNLEAGAGRNVLIGARAGQSITTGNENILIGQSAGRSITTTGGNIGLGTSSVQLAGNSNVGIGYLSARDGSYNVGVGAYTLQATGVDSSYNIAMGYLAGFNNQGDHGVFLGGNSGYENVSGDDNTFIGYASGHNVLGSGNVALGYKAGYNETGSNKLYIANSDTATPLIYGDFTSGLTFHSQATSGVPVTIKGNASQTANLTEWQDSSGNVLASIDNLGKLYISSQTLLATPVAGTFEFDNDRMYLTNVATQRAIDRTSGVITSTTTVANTTTETTIFTGTLAANALKDGNILKTLCMGVVSTANASDTVTLRVKIGSTTIATVATTAGNVTNEPWNLSSIMTVRSVGATGTVSNFTKINVSGADNSTANEATTVDTTVSEDITVTAQWDAADAGNTISIYQGMVEYKN